LIPYGNGPLLIGHRWLFHLILEYATNPVEHAGTHPNRKDFIEPPNVVDPRLRRRMAEQEELDRGTQYSFEEEGRQDLGSWFYKWQAIDRRYP
jgi:hypothetical protein